MKDTFEAWPVMDRTSGGPFALRVTVRRAAADEGAAAAELIATAFAGLRCSAYLVPDRRSRHRILAADYRIFVEHALEHGEVHFADDGQAVAVWFQRTADLPGPADYDRRLSEATGEWAERFRALDELSEQNQPQPPYHHLAFLAVHPDRQNQGLGTALLQYQHARLAGAPAYLAASDPRNRDLYARHGYQPRQPFALPDGALFWPMWRPGDA